MTRIYFSLRAVCVSAAVLGAMTGAVWAQSAGVKAGQMFAARPSWSISAIMSAQRGAMVSANIGVAADLAVRRSRDDYQDLAEMIQAETQIVTAEADALRDYNEQAESELSTFVLDLRSMRESRLSNRHAEIDELRRRIDSQHAAYAQRLAQAESELATTKELRASVDSADQSDAVWRAKEGELRLERDRLRKMLKTMMSVADGLG